MQIFFYFWLFTFAFSALPGNFPELPEYLERINITRIFIQKSNRGSRKTIIKIKKAINECLEMKNMFEQLLSLEKNWDYKFTIEEKYANACVFRDLPHPDFAKTDGKGDNSILSLLKDEQVFATERIVYLKKQRNKILKATIIYCQHVNILLEKMI
jgi:hypothetical protein